MPTRIILDVPDNNNKNGATVAAPPSRSPIKGRWMTDIEKGRDTRHQVAEKKLFSTAAATGPATTSARTTKRARQQPHQNSINTTTTNDSAAARRASTRSSTHKIIQFRSTILRDPSMEQEKFRDYERNRDGLSTTDIRASPRLVGYVYQALASLIMIVTVVQFYKNSLDEGDETPFKENLEKFQKEKEQHAAEANDEWRIFVSVNGPVYFWKLVGCAIACGIGATINIIVVLAHFDTVLLPQLWNVIFRDGSRYEQNFLRFMFIFWLGALHICTSTLSVGEVQGNVFFTAWIAFLSCVLNYGVWRTSAGFPSLAERSSLHHRETTYNWLWLTFFLCVLGGAATDKYFNRDNVVLKFKGEVVNVTKEDWLVVLIVVWSFVGVSIIALLLNHYTSRVIVINFCKGQNKIYFGWRHVEGFVILGFLGALFWLIYAQTGVDSVINGLTTNTYIGAWGSFINCVFLLGTWLRENKNIEYIVANRRSRRAASRRSSF